MVITVKPEIHPGQVDMPGQVDKIDAAVSTGRSGAYQPMIRDLPQGERPRERLRDYGPRYLSNAELIAILLRTGLQGENVLAMSGRLLARFQGLDGLGAQQLCRVVRRAGLE